MAKIYSLIEARACSNVIAARLAAGSPFGAAEYDAIASQARRLLTWALANRNAIVASNLEEEHGPAVLARVKTRLEGPRK